MAAGDRREGLGGETTTALREVALYVKENLKKRAVFASEAGVRAIELDNFLTERARDAKGIRRYKTITPSAPFQGSLLRYLTGLPEVSAIGRKRGHELYKSVRTLRASLKSLNEEREEDLLFRVLKKGRLADESTSRSIINQLAGNFYAYRRSSLRKNFIVKSFIQVHPLQSRSMTPTFTHFRKETDSNKTVRITRGVILDINKHYYFMGFVQGASSYAGIKVIIVPHPVYTKPEQMTGIFLSHDIDESYDFGMMRLVRTSESFARTRVGFFHERRINDDLSNLSLKLPIESFDGLKIDPSVLPMSINVPSPAIQQTPVEE